MAGISSFLIRQGSTGNERCSAIAIDNEANSYCAGYTTGTLGASSFGGQDAFVMKLDSNGDPVWTKQFGTAGRDSCKGVAVDKDGYVYCAGSTTGALGETNGGGGLTDAFIAKLNPNSDIEWITQLANDTKAYVGANNSQHDECNSVALDSAGENVFCGGYTKGNFGEANAGNSDAFILKLRTSNGSVQWAKQIGWGVVSAIPGVNAFSSSSYGPCISIAVGADDKIYCGGSTYTDGMSAYGLVEARASGNDAFVMKLDPSGSIDWITQLGDTSLPDGTSDETCFGIAVNAYGSVYCGGFTYSNVDGTNAGLADTFIFKLTTDGALDVQ